MTAVHRFQIAAKAGALRGNHRGGLRYHAVPLGSEAPLCGGRPAIDWKTEAGDAVTCPKCLRALADYKDPEFVSGVPEVVAF